MFIITDESGAAYEFSFETAPEGLENVAGGDTVKVTYSKSQRLIHLMELLFLLKSRRLFQLKKNTKERYQAYRLFFRNVPIYTKYFDMSYIKPYTD